MSIQQIYKVYMHKNKLNNKVYIGITSKSLSERFRNGNGYNYNAHFKSAINKYGWDGFEHILIADNLTSEQAFEMEKSLIAKYDSTCREKGYNVSFGGEMGMIGYHHTAEAKQKMSDNHWSKRGKSKLLGTKLPEYRIEQLRKRKGELSPWYGKHHTEETKRKISDSNKGEKAYWHNHKMTEEHKQHIAEGHYKAVLQMLNGVVIAEYSSAKEAEEKTGIARYNISRCCCGKRKSCGGYTWQHKEVG